MKTYTILYAIILTVFIQSCRNDDTTSLVQEKRPTIDGLWKMNTIEGGVLGIEQDFGTGLINWEFETATKKLTVSNTAVTTTGITGLTTGSYDYELKTIENREYLYIDGSEHSSVLIDSSNLILDENISSSGSVSDRFIYKLIR